MALKKQINNPLVIVGVSHSLQPNALCIPYLPSDVMRMREISAGVPITAPVAPATIPTRTNNITKITSM